MRTDKAVRAEGQHADTGEEPANTIGSYLKFQGLHQSLQTSYPPPKNSKTHLVKQGLAWKLSSPEKMAPDTAIPLVDQPQPSGGTGRPLDSETPTVSQWESLRVQREDPVIWLPWQTGGWGSV